MSFLFRLHISRKLLHSIVLLEPCTSSWNKANEKKNNNQNVFANIKCAYFVDEFVCTASHSSYSSRSMCFRLVVYGCDVCIGECLFTYICLYWRECATNGFLMNQLWTKIIKKKKNIYLSCYTTNNVSSDRGKEQKDKLSSHAAFARKRIKVI